MLLRLLILAAIAYIIYRLVWRKKRPSEGGGPSLQKGSKEDVLVKDPWCHVYVPKEQAVSLVHKGETLFFCSTECRDRFLAQGPERAKGEDRSS